MDATYGDSQMPLDAVVIAERTPHLPMLGFVVGTGLILWAWALFGSIVWALLN